MFITLEDETGIANLVVWTKVFDQYRRVVLSAGIIAVAGRVQREGEVVDIVSLTSRESSPASGAGTSRSHHRTEEAETADATSHERAEHRTSACA